jgi:protein pelota
LLNNTEGLTVRIIGKDPKGKAYKIIIDNLDDLWHLYNLIEEHDIVSGETFRRMEKPEDKLRADKIEKKRVWLAIEVERTEFHEFSNRLRVHGTITRGPEDLGLKSYHTLNFTSGSQLKLEKPELWRPHQLEQLNSAVAASKQPQVTIIAIEDDNAVIALLHHYGIRKLADIRVQGMGKLYSGASVKKSGKKPSDTKKEFFNDILLHLQQVRPENSPLIIVGPGFTKDEFMKFIKDKNLPEFSNILVDTIGQAGMVGVQEAIRRGVVKRLVQDSRVAFETEFVDKLLEGISKDDAVTYGLIEIEKMVTAGAVETLLVIDKLIRGCTEQVEQILENTEASGGNVVIISTVHDAGKQLEALGGIAAILRYKPN